MQTEVRYINIISRVFHSHAHSRFDLHTSSFQWNRRHCCLLSKGKTEAQRSWCEGSDFQLNYGVCLFFGVLFSCITLNIVLWTVQWKYIYCSPDEVWRSCLEFICALNLCWAEQRSSRYLHVFAVSVMNVCFLPLKLLSIMNFFL